MDTWVSAIFGFVFLLLGIGMYWSYTLNHNDSTHLDGSLCLIAAAAFLTYAAR